MPKTQQKKFDPGLQTPGHRWQRAPGGRGAHPRPQGVPGARAGAVQEPVGAGSTPYPMKITVLGASGNFWGATWRTCWRGAATRWCGPAAAWGWTRWPEGLTRAFEGADGRR
ncbi:hypothetical protein QJS66_13670 [Kocuria rhizophila]|nr:hypothetical protein QJS66_13670 [Kocuria rhizophila]